MIVIGADTHKRTHALAAVDEGTGRVGAARQIKAEEAGHLAGFPAAHLDKQAMEIRLVSDHRKDLVAERTRVQNRLRWHLLELCGELA